MKLRNIKYFIFGLALVVTGLFVPKHFFRPNQEEMIQSLIEQIKSLKNSLPNYKTKLAFSPNGVMILT